MTTVLNFLCAGAVQGVVKALQDTFTSETGIAVQGRFGAVGALEEALRAGEPCDVIVLTDAMIARLQGSGELLGGPRSPLGRVRTGIAVKEGERLPDIATPASLKAALLGASAIYFPDPERATAGIHFASVLSKLGIHDALQPRFRNYPNGATSMRELAGASPAGAIGCTQITEINYSPGIRLVGPLPDAFELATVYAAGISARSAEPAPARRFIDLIAGANSRKLREQGGFEFDVPA
jgi:molybdate transport system substrate-binding protein